MLFGGLSIEEAITLYFQKLDAIKRGDFESTKQLKNQHPEIFNQQVVDEIERVIRYIGTLQLNPDFRRRYEAFRREKIKEKLTIV